MGEGDAPGVEAQRGRIHRKGLGGGVGVRVAVGGIAEDGEGEVAAMEADLFGAAGAGGGLAQREQVGGPAH